MKALMMVGVVGLCAALAACGEKPQVAGTKKADQAPYATASGAYSTGDWKSGDVGAWERHLNARAQRGQNEYSRTRP